MSCNFISGGRFYHVVTEKAMELNQIIVFNRNHCNGVAKRVDRIEKLRIQNNIDMNLLDKIDKILYKDLKHWCNISDRELALEEVRKRYYPQYPSRIACLYVSKNLEDARKWADYFIELGRNTYQIVELQNDGNFFTGDANNCWYECPTKKEALNRARYYWQNKPNEQYKEPIYETIIDGKIKVVKIIKDFRN